MFIHVMKTIIMIVRHHCLCMWYSGSTMQLLKYPLFSKFFDLGICISYNSLIQLTSVLRNGICKRFQLSGIVCSSKMPTGLFTVEAANTLDHNLDYNRLISRHRDFTPFQILKVQIITYQTTVSLRKNNYLFTLEIYCCASSCFENQSTYCSTCE